MPRLRSAALFVALTLTLPGTLPSLGQAQVLDRAITMGSTVAPLSDAQMLARIEGADYLLLGERHDNPAHHQLQAWAVEALGKTSPSPPSLIVEMIPLSKARALDRHLSNNPDDAAGLGAVLSWEERGWPDYGMYQPIFEAALAANMDIKPGNLDRGITRALVRGGLPALAPAARDRLGLSTPLPAEQQQALEDLMAASHCNMLPEEMLPGMALAQRARDGFMARALIEAREASGGAPAILIAGSGHTRTDRGVGQLLQQWDPGAKVLALAFTEALEGTDDPRVYDEAGAHDILWFTEGVDRGDPCAVFQKQ